MPAQSPYGQLTLVLGPESLLAERAVAGLLARARAEQPDVEVAEIEAGRLDPAKLTEITGPSLFSTRRVAVIADVGNLAADLSAPLLTLAEEHLVDLALVVVHNGGARGKALVDRLRKLAGQAIDCQPVKTWDLPAFVTTEAKRAGGSISSDAAQLLVEAVGHDLRSLAAGVAQLVADCDGQPVEVTHVRRYFGGRAEVTSFAVADAALAGRTGLAMEQVRWAMATGVAPVLVTSAMAAGLRGLGRLITSPAGLPDHDLAREVGVPSWKLRSMRSQARGWDQRGVATALQAVAVADGEVKGAAEDADYALEQMVLTVARSRRG